ncbi:MAG TPA: hypothetical protein VMT16_15790 [Thermoanaerobaculia bacterium]|nr:hypothetical protein [Thermoanaerobaculia bacterium]
MPTVVAVTGHRRLAEPERAAAGVAEALDRLAGWRLGQPLEVLSGLAEGADRMAEEVALGRPDPRLVAVLPMPLAEYRRDFPSARSRADLDSLLARAAAWVELPAGPRPQVYEALGEELLRRADVLLAVWDGGPPGGPGGTAAVVARARTLGKPLAWVVAAQGRSPSARSPPAGDQPSVRYERL